MESFKHDDENNRNEDKYTDKDGTELENKAELVWEGQVRTGDVDEFVFESSCLGGPGEDWG